MKTRRTGCIERIAYTRRAVGCTVSAVLPHFIRLHGLFFFALSPSPIHLSQIGGKFMGFTSDAGLLFLFSTKSTNPQGVGVSDISEGSRIFWRLLWCQRRNATEGIMAKPKREKKGQVRPSETHEAFPFSPRFTIRSPFPHTGPHSTTFLFRTSIIYCHQASTAFGAFGWNCFAAKCVLVLMCVTQLYFLSLVRRYINQRFSDVVLMDCKLIQSRN